MTPKKIRHIRPLSLAAWLVLTGLPVPAQGGPCRAVRRSDRDTCVRAQCAELTGGALRACRRRCRPPAVRTLAYIATECRAPAGGGTVAGRQSLRLRHGDCPPVAVLDVSAPEPVPDPIAVCANFAESRSGFLSVAFGVLQRVAASPDGSRVVFEVTKRWSLFPALTAQVTVDEGIFVVRADGSGLRRLGPASQDRNFRLLPDPTSPLGVSAPSNGPGFAFSPDGRLVAFTDRGPGSLGEDAAQVFLLDLDSAERTQVTRLPPAGDILGLRFLDARTLLFSSDADVSPPRRRATYRIGLDGAGLRPQTPAPVPIPGARIVPTFETTSGIATLATWGLPGTAVGPRSDSSISEVFLSRGRTLLQLTNFHHTDTGRAFLSADGQHAFFRASADPLGTNPTGNCQLFSTDDLGAHLRQITSFRDGDLSRPSSGCHSAATRCASVNFAQDERTQAIVFYSSCDPVKTNPAGGQVFAIRPDGSGPRQLTDTRGIVVGPDGSLTVELPGPFSYSAVVR